jgi:hypothetical protein
VALAEVGARKRIRVEWANWAAPQALAKQVQDAGILVVNLFVLEFLRHDRGDSGASLEFAREDMGASSVFGTRPVGAQCETRRVPDDARR